MSVCCLEERKEYVRKKWGGDIGGRSVPSLEGGGEGTLQRNHPLIILLTILAEDFERTLGQSFFKNIC